MRTLHRTMRFAAGGQDGRAKASAAGKPDSEAPTRRCRASDPDPTEQADHRPRPFPDDRLTVLPEAQSPLQLQTVLGGATTSRQRRHLRLPQLTPAAAGHPEMSREEKRHDGPPRSAEKTHPHPTPQLGSPHPVATAARQRGPKLSVS